MVSVASNKIELRRVEAEHLPMVLDFYRTVWGTGSEESDTQTALTGTSFERAPAVIAIRQQHIIGYLGTLPMRLWKNDREGDAHWFKGFMVVPEFRNGPVGFALVREAMRHVDDVAVLTVQPASWRLFQAAGLTRVGAVPNYLRVLRPARVAQRLSLARVPLGHLPGWALSAARLAQRTRLAGLAGAIGGAIASGLVAVRGTGDAVTASPALDDADRDLDDTWNRMRSHIRFAQTRDAAYVGARYGAADGTVFKSHRVVGRAGAAFTMVRRPRTEGDERLSGLSVAVLSDIIAPLDAPRLTLAAVRRAEEDARAMGADAMVCSISHASTARLLRRRAWFRIPANLQFLARLKDGSAGTLDDWWLTRADGNSDEGF
jgi:RimJ/RimL family protein N-acetyltransferase